MTDPDPTTSPTTSTEPELVLLVDDNGGTLLVECPDLPTAEGLAASAVFSPYRTSAFRVKPDAAVAYNDTMKARLRRGDDLDVLAVDATPHAGAPVWPVLDPDDAVIGGPS